MRNPIAKSDFVINAPCTCILSSFNRMWILHILERNPSLWPVFPLDQELPAYCRFSELSSTPPCYDILVCLGDGHHIIFLVVHYTVHQRVTITLVVYLSYHVLRYYVFRVLPDLLVWELYLIKYQLHEGVITVFYCCCAIGCYQSLFYLSQWYAITNG